MCKFLVTGGLQRKDACLRGEGHRFEKARLLAVDYDAGETRILIDYEGVPEFYPEETPNILFTAATLSGDKLYLCSETEIFVYSYPSMTLQKKTSHPFFQNVHHVTPVLGYIAVASTGLDLVVLLDQATLEPVKFINPLGKDPWHRFSSEVDYRKVNSTKPHDVHPNFVFENDDQIWVTRFNQRDAVCIDDPSKRIDIGIERIHDGHVIDDYVYFTSVNGCIVVANRFTYKVEEIIDLNLIEKKDIPLGWCRGMALIDGIAYVGFSRLRKTAIKENINWALKYLGVGRMLDTRISAYDLTDKKKVGEMVLPDDASNAIYSILPC